jgi:hypothetical protein
MSAIFTPNRNRGIKAVPCVTPKMGRSRWYPHGVFCVLRRRRRPRDGQRHKFLNRFCYVNLTELGALRSLAMCPSPISVREHCEDSPDDRLAILEGVHRDLADAIAIVNANLADTAVAIAARYADFPDRSPAHLAMVAKREPCFIEFEWPVQTVQPKRCAAQSER